MTLFFLAKKCERNIFIQSCYLKFAYRYIVVVECAISFRQEIALTFSFVSKFRMQFVQYDISYYWVVGSGSPCVYGKCVRINAVRMENVYRQRAHSPWHWNCERNEERHYLVQCCSAGGISMLSVQRSLFFVHCVRLFPCTSTIMLGHHHFYPYGMHHDLDANVIRKHLAFVASACVLKFVSLKIPNFL